LNEPDHDSVRRFVESTKPVHLILSQQLRCVARIDPGGASKADFADGKKIIFQAGAASPGAASPRRRRSHYNPDGNDDGNDDNNIGQSIPHALLITANMLNIQSNKGSRQESKIVAAR
jgi:hypothetical protein